MLDEERTGPTLVCQTTLSVPKGKLDTVNIDPLANVASATLSETVAVGSPYNCETMLNEDEVIRNLDLLRTMKGILGGLVRFCILDCI